MKFRWPLLLLCSAVGVTYFPLLMGSFYATGDTRDLFIPLELFFQHEQREGRLPAWHPDIAWGYPVIAAAQIGFFYPPLLLARWLLPIKLYLPALVISHMLALAIGTYAMLRARKTSELGAYVGSISFALSGFVVQHITHLNIIFALAWLPWQLSAAVTIAKKECLTRHDVTRLMILLSVPYLAGQLQVPFLMSAVTSALFIYTRWSIKRMLGSSLGAIAILAIGTFCLAAAQILPTLELARHSSRAENGDFDIQRANQHSFPLYHLPTLLFPRFYGHDHTYWGKRLEIEYGFFVGTIPALLALWAIIKSFRIKNWKLKIVERQNKFWLWLLLVSFLLALGSLSPFRLLGFEPSLWYFSAPARWLLFTALSLSILAAAGLDKLQEDYRGFRKLATGSALVVTIVVVLGNLTLFVKNNHLPNILINIVNTTAPQLVATKPHSYYLNKLSTLAASAQRTSVSVRSPYTALPLLMLVIAIATVERRRAAAILTAAAATELIIIGMVTLTPTVSWERILEPPATLERLPLPIKQKESRIFSIRSSGDTGAYFTDPQSRANPQIREQQRHVLVPLLSAQFGVPGVEWPAALDIFGHEIILEKMRGDGSYLIQDLKLASELNIGALLAPKNTEVPSEIQLYAKLPDTNIYTLNPAPRASLVDKQGNPVEGSAQYQNIEPTKTRIITEASQETTLLIRDTKFPGWRATIDGVAAPIGTGLSIFRLISIPAGQHTVEMKYVPHVLYIGMFISGITLMLCLAANLTKKQM